MDPLLSVNYKFSLIKFCWPFWINFLLNSTKSKSVLANIVSSSLNLYQRWRLTLGNLSCLKKMLAFGRNILSARIVGFSPYIISASCYY